MKKTKKREDKNKITFNDYVAIKSQMLKKVSGDSSVDICASSICERCPLSKFNNGYEMSCNNLELLYPQEVINIIIEYIIESTD